MKISLTAASATGAAESAPEIGDNTRRRPIPLTYIVDSGEDTDQTTTTNPNEGRIVGIQTRIAEHLVHHADLSSPFFQDAPPTRKPTRDDAGTCDFMHLQHGCCQLPIGHVGAHVFRGREQTQHETKL